MQLFINQEIKLDPYLILFVSVNYREIKYKNSNKYKKVFKENSDNHIDDLGVGAFVAYTDIKIKSHKWIMINNIKIIPMKAM